MGAFNPGMVAGDFDPVNQSAFVVEHKAFSDLIISLVRPCPCHVRAHWALHSSVQVSIMLRFHYFVNMIYMIYRRVMFYERNSDAPSAIEFVRGQVPECLVHII